MNMRTALSVMAAAIVAALSVALTVAANTVDDPSATQRKAPVRDIHGTYVRTYADVLDQLRIRIDACASQDDVTGEPLEGFLGVLERCRGKNPAEVLARLGYAVRDINADGAPELLIGEIEERKGTSCRGSLMYAAYAQTGGMIYCLLEGTARNSFQLLDDGSFFNQGSAGAMYSIFGRYVLPPHATAAACRDYYFTCEKDETFREVIYCHNHSGQFDKAVSRRIAKAEYDAARSAYAARISAIQLVPLAAHAAPVRADASSVVAQWAEALPEGTPHEEFIADSTEQQVRIAFSSPAGVKDFKVLALSITHVDEHGRAAFSTKELYALPGLRPERPLVLGMTFLGSTPQYGISFVDAQGETRRFFIAQSGEDGSVLLQPF